MLFIGLLLTTACKQSVNKEQLIEGLASPFILQSDTAIFYLTDYVVDYNQADSVVFPASIASIMLNDSVFQLIHNERVKPLERISIYKNGTYEIVPVIYRKKHKITIPYKNAGGLKNLRVIGSMNAWNRGNAGMRFENEVWVQDFEVTPGVYEYLFYADGKEFSDPENPDRMGRNSIIRVGKYLPEDLPFLETVSFSVKSISLKTNQPIDDIIVTWQNQEIPASVDTQKITIHIPKAAKFLDRSYIRVYASNSNGHANDILVPLQNGKVITDASKLTRSDKQTMIMYFLMVDRFFNGDTTNDEPVNDPAILPKANYFGGDLAGVNQKLHQGYFEELGINTLWLSPISQNPKGAYGLFNNPVTKFSGYHGYWPVSLTQIDYRFGNSEILHALIDGSHQKDMNVLLDYVAHHVHQEHPVIQQRPDWTTPLYLPDGTMNTEKWDEHRLTTWFDTFLPTLDMRRKEVVDAMVDSATFWYTSYGIDGFRHDATKHIDELYWRTLTKKIKALTAGKSFYQIGETYGSPLLISSYISSGMLDAQFDFNVYDNAVACFAFDNENFNRLKSILGDSWKYYGYHNLMGNISGNQDRARFISYAGGSLSPDEDAKVAGWKRDITVGDTVSYSKLKMLHAFNMTIPGIPVIYYGDEIGMPGGNDPDNRRQMKFTDLTEHEYDVFETVRKLSHIRRDNMALLFGQTRIIQADDKILAYTRNYFNDRILVVFNKSRLPQVVIVPVAGINTLPTAGFGSEIITRDGTHTILIKPLSFDIIHY